MPVASKERKAYFLDGLDYKFNREIIQAKAFQEVFKVVLKMKI